MFSANELSADTPLIAALAAVAVGLVALWSNPQREINRRFCWASFYVSGWLVLLQLALVSEHGLYWLRITTAVGAGIPLQVWLIKEAIDRGEESYGRSLVRGGFWVSSAVGLAALCFTPYFIPANSTAAHPLYGIGYHVFSVAIPLMYLAQCVQGVRQMRAQTGARRMELQILLLGASAATIAVSVMMSMRAIFGLQYLIRLQPLVIIGFYTAVLIAITTSRIFDARQLLFAGLQKLVLVGAVSAGAYILMGILRLALPAPIAFVVTTAVALWFAASLDGWLDTFLHFYPRDTAARQAAYLAARNSSGLDNLERSFTDILKGWGQSDHAVILSGYKGMLRGGGVEVMNDSPAVTVLRSLRWATPERLARERSSPDRLILSQFLSDNRLGATVLLDGPVLSVLAGVGVSASRQPFTYPQVTQLIELGSIIEGALERSHLSAKAQRAEQLATVGLLGASFAHEIRNPLVSIKTFVQLLPRHYDDPAFRDKFFRLIGDEVSRIDRLTEQLLDLASPRAYLPQMVQLHPVLRSSIDLASAKASDKQVTILEDFSALPDFVHTDPAAARQVLLNLCFNAIQAVENRPGERWIKVATRKVPEGVEMTVSDNGPGVAPEIRPRLFEPFQTTKSSGFGLGLAICVDILASLNASLAVDPPVPGVGATFRVIFPCQPSSS